MKYAINTQKPRADKHIWVILIVYVLGVLAHFFLADFLKTIGTFPDETLYIDLARSFANGSGLVVRGADVCFQKVLYSLLISPFFLIPQSIRRVRMLSLFNCMVLMSSVFPVELLGKKIGLNKKFRLLIAVLVMLWPDMMYSMTFMSEILFWPLFLWAVYFWLLKARGRRPGIACLCGFFYFLCYLTKEAAISLIGVDLFFSLTFPYIEKKYSRKPVNRARQKDGIFQFLLTGGVFLAAYLIFRFLILRNPGAYYDQASPDVLGDIHTLLYWGYAIVYYLVAILMALLIVPYVGVFANLRKLSQAVRALFLYAVFYLVLMAVSTTYTVTIREDLGQLAPRLHFRYFAPGVLLVLICFFFCCQFLKMKKLFNWKRLIVLGLVMAACLFLMRGTFRGSDVDQYVLEWYQSTAEQFQDGLDPQLNGDTIYQIALAMNAVVIAVGIIILVLFTRVKKQIGLLVYCLCIAAAFIVSNNYVNASVRNIYSANEEMVGEAQRISDYFSQIDGESKLFLGDYAMQSLQSRQMDLYMDDSDQLYFFDLDYLTESTTEHHLPVDSAEFRAQLWCENWKNDPILKAREYAGLDHIDYYIIQNKLLDIDSYDFSTYEGFQKWYDDELSQRGFCKLDHLERIDEISGVYYSVYANTEPSSLDIVFCPSRVYTGNPMWILFTGDDYAADIFVKSGVSEDEGFFSWTLGDEMHVVIPSTIPNGIVNVEISIVGEITSPQHYAVDTPVGRYSGKIKGMMHLTIPAEIKNGVIDFTLELPDASVINEVYESGDYREVALMVDFMVIRK